MRSPPTWKTKQSFAGSVDYRENRRYQRLLPAIKPSLPQQRPARAALEAATNDDRPVGLVWVVVNAFIRLTTKPGLFERPLAIGEARELVEGWLEHPLDSDFAHFPSVRWENLLSP